METEIDYFFIAMSAPSPLLSGLHCEKLKKVIWEGMILRLDMSGLSHVFLFIGEQNR